MMTGSVPPTGPPAPSPKPPLTTVQAVLRLAALAAVLAVGGIALLGIPGALWMAPGALVAGFFTTARLPADGAWPMAIIITLIWPWFLPLSYLGAATRSPPGRDRWLVTLVATAILSTLLAAALQVANGVMG